MRDEIVADVSFRFVVDKVAVLGNGGREYRASCYDLDGELLGEYWSTDVNEAMGMSLLEALGEDN